MSWAPLAGKRVVTTRDEPGQVDRLLAEAGATVLHLPLIAIVDAEDGGAGLTALLDRVDDFDWLIVTSQHGAIRVGAAARGRRVRLAARLRGSTAGSPCPRCPFFPRCRHRTA